MVGGNLDIKITRNKQNLRRACMLFENHVAYLNRYIKYAPPKASICLIIRIHNFREVELHFILSLWQT